MLSGYQCSSSGYVRSRHGRATQPYVPGIGVNREYPIARGRQINAFQAVAGEASQVVVPIGCCHRDYIRQIIRGWVVRSYVVVDCVVSRRRDEEHA